MLTLKAVKQYDLTPSKFCPDSSDANIGRFKTAFNL